MANTNRLLDMLKSAASPPPQPTSQPTPPQSSSSTPFPPNNNLFSPPHPAQVLSQGAQSPSDAVSPPPPTLSIHDLFASITSPPPPAAKSPPPPAAPQTNLLDMFKRVGGAGGAITPAASQEKELNGNGPANPGSFGPIGSGINTPDNGAASPAGPISPSGDHRQTHASVGKPSSSIPAPVQPPVLAHPSARPAASGLPSPARSHHTDGSGKSAEQNAAPAVIHDAVSPPPAALRSTPFDFVSPFDAFKPKSRSPAPTPSKRAVQQPVESPLSANTVPAPKAPQSSLQLESTPVAKMLSPHAPVTQKEDRSRVPSGASGASNASTAGDLGLPWLVNKVVQKGSEGSGPKAVGNNITIDFSKPCVDGLVNAPGAVQIVPTTIMKSDNVGFSKGRSVGVNSTWLAYTLRRGRIRLIDKASGARLVLQIPNVNSGSIIDLAVSPRTVAVVGPDRSVTVFSVPATWDRDDPEYEVVAHVSHEHSTADQAVGEVNHVEWVKRDGPEWRLAIGGDDGVVIIDPRQHRGENNLTISGLENRYKVLLTEGHVAAFCLNHSHQAIALVSTKGHLTLYSVQTLARVWNRQLPSSSSPGKSSAPSSILFCEPNVLVGRDNNTQFDLVQITVEIAVIGQIKLIAPSPSPSQLNFSQVIYDSTRNTLWIAPFSRGSLYGIRYALKGIAPFKPSDRPDLRAFDKIAEYPLEPVTSIVLAHKNLSEDVEFFFAIPTGFSQAHIERSAVERLSSSPLPKPTSAPVQPAEVEVKSEAVAEQPVKKGKGGITPQKNASPAVVKTELPEEVPYGLEQSPLETQSSSGVSQDEIGKLLKRSEDKIANNLKQTLNNQLSQVNSRLDAISNGELGLDIASKVEKQIKASVSTLVQNEVKRSLLPALQTSIQTEVRNAVTSSTPLAVSSALQSVPRELEKSLGAVVQRIIADVVQQSVDRAVQESVQSVLLPAFTSASAQMVNQLSQKFHSEMVQIRKDFAPPPRRDSATQEPHFQTLAASIADLQRQVSSLSGRLTQSPAAPMSNGVTHSIPVGPAPAAHPPHAPHPVLGASATQQPNLGGQQLEDKFLATLSTQSNPAALGLLNEYWSQTDQILPAHGRSPLGQAIILTLIHRLALALPDMHPSDPTFQRILHWEYRAAALLDPRSPEIASYYSRVLPVAQSNLGSVIQNLPARWGDHGSDNARAVRGVLDILANKSA